MRALPLFSFLLFALSSVMAGEGCFRFFSGSFKVIDGHPAYAVAKKRFVSLHCPEHKKIIADDRFKS
jgi:hypothetical protein